MSNRKNSPYGGQEIKMTGKELKKIRGNLEMSQWQLAVKLGVSQGSITNWESEYTKIPLDIQAQVLKMDYDHEVIEKTADNIMVKAFGLGAE